MLDETALLLIYLIMHIDLLILTFTEIAKHLPFLLQCFLNLGLSYICPLIEFIEVKLVLGGDIGHQVQLILLDLWLVRQSWLDDCVWVYSS